MAKYKKIYHLGYTPEEKEKFIKQFLSLIKNSEEGEKYSYTEIVNMILKATGDEEKDKAKNLLPARTICHKRIYDEAPFSDSSAWGLCMKRWLLVRQNPKLAKKIAKEYDRELAIERLSETKEYFKKCL